MTFREMDCLCDEFWQSIKRLHQKYQHLQDISDSKLFKKVLAEFCFEKKMTIKQVGEFTSFLLGKIDGEVEKEKLRILMEDPDF